MNFEKLIGENENLAEPYTLACIRTFARSRDRIAAYQNHAMDSADLGKLIFLMIGPGRTYSEPPLHAPDGELHGSGWKYRLVGFFDKENNRLLPEEKQPVQGDGVASSEQAVEARADRVE